MGRAAVQDEEFRRASQQPLLKACQESCTTYIQLTNRSKRALVLVLLLMVVVRCVEWSWAWRQSMGSLALVSL